MCVGGWAAIKFSREVSGGMSVWCLQLVGGGGG